MSFKCEYFCCLMYQMSMNLFCCLSISASKIVVRPEEAVIVILVLFLWACAIGLFVHRWGKIRNCEPYTPKFEEDIGASCPLTTMDPIISNKRMSLGPLTSLQCGSFCNPNTVGISRGGF